jgi:hypothetical protein
MNKKISKEPYEIYIPSNDVIEEHGYLTHKELVDLLRRHKDNPNAIQFIADMME